MRFFPLKVKGKEDLTQHACFITFHLSTELIDHFNYIPGQFITIRYTDKKGENHYRCYSICGSIDKKELAICVKKVKDGLVSNYLCDKIKIGSVLIVGAPKGKFNLVAGNSFVSKNIVFITGGSGITPIKSMINALHLKNYQGNIFLIYGNRDEKNIIFYETLNLYNNENANLNVTHVISNPSVNWNGEKGLLSEEKLNAIIKKYKVPISDAHFYLCGPPILLNNANKVLKELGINDNRIFIEKFSQLEADQPIAFIKEPVPCKIITKDLQSLIKIKPKQSLLDAVLDAGIQVEYSCKSGVCLSCVAKLNEGKVHSAVDYPGEEKYILTCQSFPLNNKIELDYNLKETTTKYVNRNKIVVMSLLIALSFILVALHPKNEPFFAKGKCNIGHENLACSDCHESSIGTIRQQLQTNAKSMFGLESGSIYFGKKPVSNTQCLKCHERPNDRHPTHRFMEPRFKEARAIISPENCISCHTEHNDKRITQESIAYCKNCHQDIEIANDPLDIKHQDLIQTHKWNTCLQCHDYHGNHIMEVPTKMKDTISLKIIKEYYSGGEDPYSEIKEFIVKMDTLQ